MHVLTSDFFWGVVVGVVLTAIGAWLQALFVIWRQQKTQKDLIKNFCIDTINNIKAIVDDMVAHQQRTKAIHPDHLALLDIEWNVFGRSRAQLIHLPKSVRENVRKFVTDCAIRKAEIGNYRSQYLAFANQLQSQGQAQQPNLVQQQAQAAASANQALNQLAIRVSGSAELVKSLQQVR